jgi:hypothetical protein
VNSTITEDRGSSPTLPRAAASAAAGGRCGGKAHVSFPDRAPRCSFPSGRRLRRSPARRKRRWIPLEPEGKRTPRGCTRRAPRGVAMVLVSRSACSKCRPSAAPASSEVASRVPPRGWRSVGSAGRAGFGRRGPSVKAGLVLGTRARRPARRTARLRPGACLVPASPSGGDSSPRPPAQGAPADGDSGPHVGRKPMGASSDSTAARPPGRNGLVDG